MSRNEKPTRQGIWAFARQCMLDAKGDRAKAEDLVRERAPKTFGSIWVTIVISIALFLLKRWLDNRTTNPSETPDGADDFDRELNK